VRARARAFTLQPRSLTSGAVAFNRPVPREEGESTCGSLDTACISCSEMRSSERVAVCHGWGPRLTVSEDDDRSSDPPGENRTAAAKFSSSRPSARDEPRPTGGSGVRSLQRIGFLIAANDTVHDARSAGQQVFCVQPGRHAFG
jgi:hypothetical protein